MFRSILSSLVIAALIVPAAAQQQDPGKLETWLSAQRNQALDAAASLAAENARLRQQVADLEKRIADAEAKTGAVKADP